MYYQKIKNLWQMKGTLLFEKAYKSIGHNIHSLTKIAYFYV